VTAEEHHNYMENYSDQYFICLENNVPIGYIGTNAQGYISIAVASGTRGKGVGKFMLKTFCSLKKEANYRAIVSVTNEASLKLFESCGFEKKYYTFEG
jgi:ribosomal protein S18 acetylase RimI-like enzyme